MACASAAWADKPEQYPMESFQVTGELVGDCGDFLVLSDYRVEETERRYFNSDGTLNRIMFDMEFPDGIYYNSNDPSYWLPGKAEHRQVWYHFKDGVAYDAVVVGPTYRVVAPGYGVVLIDTGRFVFDLTLGEITFSAGPHDVIISGDFDAICAALRP